MARTRKRLLATIALGATVAMAIGGCAASAPTGWPTASSPATSKPTPTPTVDPIEAFARQRLATMSLRQHMASLLMLHIPGTDAAAMRAFIDRYRTGGLIFMGDNIAGGIDDTAALVAAASATEADFPVLIGIDQEGGDVRRIR